MKYCVTIYSITILILAKYDDPYSTNLLIRTFLFSGKVPVEIRCETPIE